MKGCVFYRAIDPLCDLCGSRRLCVSSSAHSRDWSDPWRATGGSALESHAETLRTAEGLLVSNALSLDNGNRNVTIMGCAATIAAIARIGRRWGEKAPKQGRCCGAGMLA